MFKILKSHFFWMVLGLTCFCFSFVLADCLSVITCLGGYMCFIVSYILEEISKYETYDRYYENSKAKWQREKINRVVVLLVCLTVFAVSVGAFFWIHSLLVMFVSILMACLVVIIFGGYFTLKFIDFCLLKVYQKKCGKIE